MSVSITKQEFLKFLCSIQSKSFILLVSGKSCTGKSYLSSHLKKEFGAAIIHGDNWSLTEEQILRSLGKPDFEAVDAYDLSNLRENVGTLLTIGEVSIPRYDFRTEKISAYDIIKLASDQILVIEFIHAFNETIMCETHGRELIKVYLELDETARLLRRIFRDINERGKDTATAVRDWLNSYEGYEEIKRQADFIVQDHIADHELDRLISFYSSQIRTESW